MSSNQAGVYRGGNTTGTTGTTGGVTDETPLRNTTGTAGTGVISAQRGEPICDQKYYTKVCSVAVPWTLILLLPMSAVLSNTIDLSEVLHYL